MSALESKASILAIVAMSVAAALVFALLPIITGATADRFGLTTEQIGLVAFYYFVPYAVVSASASLWIDRVKWRLARTVGFTLMLAGLSVAISAGSFDVMSGGMALVAAGAALLFPICMTASALQSNPNRIFALRLTAEQMVPAILLVSVTLMLGGVIEFERLFALMVGIIVVTGLLSLGLPRAAAGEVVVAEGGEKGRVNFPALLALCLNFAGYAALWAFFERVGADRNFDAGFIALWLSVALVTAGLGPLIAIALERSTLGNRLGVVASLVLVGCMVWLWQSAEPVVYAISLAIIPMAYGVTLVFLLSSVAAADSAGKSAALMPFALAVAAAVGPLMFGYLWAGGLPVILISAACILAGAWWLLVRQAPASLETGI
ncbi:MAG: MFS transporter [Halieaceae bacterium]